MGYRYSLSGDERLIGLLHDCLLEVLLREGFGRTLELEAVAGPQIAQFTRGEVAVTVELEVDAEGAQARLVLEADGQDPRPLLKHAGTDLLEMCAARAVAPALGVPPGELVGKLRRVLQEFVA